MRKFIVFLALFSSIPAIAFPNLGDKAVLKQVVVDPAGTKTTTYIIIELTKMSDDGKSAELQTTYTDEAGKVTSVVIKDLEGDNLVTQATMAAIVTDCVHTLSGT